MSTTLQTPNYTLQYYHYPVATDYVENGAMTRVYDEPTKILEFSFHLKGVNSSALSIEYMAHLSNIGDTKWIKEWDNAGTGKEHNQIEGFAFRLTGSDQSYYRVRYRAHLRGTGLTDWYYDGDYCGTRGQTRAVEGMQVQIFLKQDELKNAFLATKQYRTWHNNGGVRRTNLPEQEANTLYDQITNFNNRMAFLRSAIGKVNDSWSRLNTASSSPLIKILAQKLLQDLDYALATSDTVGKSATDVKIKADEFLTIVKAYIKEDERIIENAKRELPRIDARMEAAQKMKAEAQEELTGAKGFGNGFLTGITLGIHNPVKDNLEKAEEAIAAINTARRDKANQISARNKSKAELEGSENLLINLSDIESAVTAFQNTMTNVKREIGEASKDIDRLGNTSSERLLQIFRDNAGKDMDDFRSWSTLIQQLS